MKKRIKKIRNLTIGIVTILFLGNSFRLIKGNKEAIKVISNHQNSNNHEENIVAHRGFSGIYPDNSYLAISKALELQCVDMIEIDVRLTSDKSVVLHHDKNTNINDLIVSISKVDLTDIEDDLAINDFNLYNLGDINTEDSIFLFSRYLSKSKYQSYLIRLKNILFLFKDSKTLIIDIKTNKVDYQFIEELNKLLMDYQGNIYIQSNCYEFLIYMQEKYPSYKYLFIVNSKNDITKMSSNFDGFTINYKLLGD
ncbi:MAG: glycerophosphodiester phosphodiesterase, partial [Bacilli bacterium]